MIDDNIRDWLWANGATFGTLNEDGSAILVILAHDVHHRFIEERLRAYTGPYSMGESVAPYGVAFLDNVIIVGGFAVARLARPDVWARLPKTDAG